MTPFDRARAVADAVLFEGYALYPYRASAPKNQLRWQFGVLAPPAWSEDKHGDPWWMETQCLVEAPARATLRGRLRFLRVRRRSVEADFDGTGFRPVPSLEAAGQLLLPWSEGELHEIDFTHVIDPAGGDETLVPFALDGDHEIEPVALAARQVRTRAPLAGAVRVSVDAVVADRPLVRLRVRVENRTAWQAPAVPRAELRDEALTASCLNTHLFLALDEDRFLSLADPPPWAKTAASACRNTRAWPVLAGATGRRDLVLASPIILSDHPQVAPESPGDLFDATEIDEILTLRTLTLTDDEKRQARATDARVAALIDRVEATAPEVWERLHGARRAPPLGPGTRVRLRPGARRTDAQDLFLVGQIARVEKVMQDVDGRDCVAVLVEDDPAAELHRWHGRYLYFYPDEIELLEG
jgi:hypothetical protein